MKHTLRTKWLASANRGHCHFPHYFRGSYEYLIHYQSKNSRAHYMVVHVHAQLCGPLH